MTTLSTDLQAKFDQLIQRIASFGKVVVAFSGGLDSGFVLYTAVKALGPENVLAVTGDAESLARDDKDYAERFVEIIGIKDRHLVVRTDELKDESYVSNPTDRCFFCKRELYGKLQEVAKEKGFPYLLDGCNASDVGDHRPGRRAAAKFSVESPLLDAGLYKEQIRELARSEGLEIWDKPQAACLASRIPYGDQVTAEKLSMVELAEKFLREKGFRQTRVRHHGKIARIELEKEDMKRILDDALRQEIVDKFLEIGFLWIALDLKPFKTGSMNIMIGKGEG